jgi:hypothetical protein
MLNEPDAVKIRRAPTSGDSLSIKTGDRVLIGDDVVDPAWRGTIVEVISQTIAGEDRPLYKVMFDHGLDGTFGPELITEVKHV